MLCCPPTPASPSATPAATACAAMISINSTWACTRTSVCHGGEDTYLQFRAEMFDLLNHTNFLLCDAILSLPDEGELHVLQRQDRHLYRERGGARVFQGVCRGGNFQRNAGQRVDRTPTTPAVLRRTFIDQRFGHNLMSYRARFAHREASHSRSSFAVMRGAIPWPDEYAVLGSSSSRVPSSADCAEPKPAGLDTGSGELPSHSVRAPHRG